VALGGAIGSVLRYLMTPVATHPFPLAIMAVNVLGCFGIGFVARKIPLIVSVADQPLVKAFLITGILGGFTTFSSFALEAGQLLEKGQFLWAMLYVVGTVSVCLAAFFIAYFGFK
jgi:CrcB protein